MPRGLDHIVHAVRDLDAAAEFYRRAGFTVGARNRHPWGTHNHIVQLPGFFVEILTLAEPQKLGEDGMSRLFGTFNGDFIARHDGLSLLMLESEDAARDEADFRRAGIAASEVVRFEREGKRPDGSTVKVGFSLAFARDATSTDAAFAVCQQHYPENFWNPAFQNHANAVTGIAGVVLVADNPTDHHIFLTGFSGQRELQSNSSGVAAATPRGDIQIMERAAYRAHFGIAPPEPGEGMRISAIRFKSGDLAATRAVLDAAGIPATMLMQRLIIGPQAAFGATLVFEPDSEPG